MSIVSRVARESLETVLPITISAEERQSDLTTKTSKNCLTAFTTQIGDNRYNL